MSMAALLPCRHFYVTALTLAGLFLVLFHYYYSANITTTGMIESTVSFKDGAISTTDKQGIQFNHQEWNRASYPWIGDPYCQHLPVQFAKNKTRLKWALTSFPGSGVTWTRQLIEGATGIYTGTVYGVSEPPIVATAGGHHGNEADFNCGCTILIKDHDGTEVDNLPAYLEEISNTSMNAVRREEYDKRAILLLRNPIDALFTYAHYLMTGDDQTGTVSPTMFRGPAWNHYVNYVAYAWADHATRWIRNIRNGTVVFYELLLRDTEAELNRLLRAVNLSSIDPAVDPERMRCTLAHKNRSDRKRSKKPTIPLTPGQYSKLVASIQRVQDSLRQKGWPLLPLRLYNLNAKSSRDIS